MITIRVLFFNCLSVPIILDDIHACIHERQSLQPVPMTIDYEGKLVLLKGNTVEKTPGRSYSFNTGDGGEYDIVMQLTKGTGVARFVFGLVVDYYSIATSNELRRRRMASDCLWLLTFGSPIDLGIGQVFGEVRLARIDSKTVESLNIRWSRRKGYLRYLAQLAQLLADHRCGESIPLP